MLRTRSIDLPDRKITMKLMIESINTVTMYFYTYISISCSAVHVTRGLCYRAFFFPPFSNAVVRARMPLYVPRTPTRPGINRRNSFTISNRVRFTPHVKAFTSSGLMRSSIVRTHFARFFYIITLWFGRTLRVRQPSATVCCAAGVRDTIITAIGVGGEEREKNTPD